MTDTLHRSIHDGTNLSCDSGNRLPNGVVSTVSRGPPFLVFLSFSFLLLHPSSKGKLIRPFVLVPSPTTAEAAKCSHRTRKK